MAFNPFNPFTWPSYRGGKDNSIAVEYDVVNGQRVHMELDTFTMGSSKDLYYPDNYNKYVRLQSRVAVVNNAVSKIANLLAMADFTSENKNDKIVDKINNPNEKQSKQEFLKEYATYLKSAGWTVIWKRFKSFGVFDTLELININPDTCEFTTNGESIIFEYEDKEETVNLSDVIIFYDSVRDKNGKGYSKLKPLRSQINNIIDAQKAKGIQIENSGTTIVSPKAPNNNNVTDEGLNALVHPDVPGQISQKQQIEDKLNHRGISNRIVVASKGLDALNLSAQLNSFKFDETVEADVLMVYDAFGVPVELTPYGKNNTYENKKEAELSLLQKEVMPLGESLTQSLNAEFDGRGKADINFNHLDCMSVVEERVQKTNTEKINQVKTLLDSGLIDIPKAQTMLETIIPK